ncbi:MAG: DUF4876 domain-containing protein [Bacteroidales bacterium]|nr:DUF4876 domain-containing protein [Bacteroidales bacterium]
MEYPEGYSAAADVNVKLTNTISGAISEKTTDATGIAAFEITAGTYEVVASETRTDEYFTYNINGLKSNLIVTSQWTGDIVPLPLTVTTVPALVEGDPTPKGRVIIKELYNGGCQKDDAGTFSNDKYAILYNNSNQAASLENLCFATTFPSNSQATNNFFVNGELTYEAEGWLPAAFSIWTFQGNVTLEAGKQIVIAFENAVNNTITYSNSINFAHAEYYCAYDIAVLNNANYYPSPSEVIPTSHYLKAYKFANVTANAWTLSTTSPALIIFKPEGITPAELAADADRTVLHGTSASQAAKKVPIEWVVDGIEVYTKGNASNKKRLTPTIDVGYVELTNAQGYTLYRNVDKAATEAIAANTGKLVYNYNFGTDGSTDPSGIDAEASIKAGARIIYKDTNNSSNDFHQRSRASLRN